MQSMAIASHDSLFLSDDLLSADLRSTSCSSEDDMLSFFDSEDSPPSPDDTDVVLLGSFNTESLKEEEDDFMTGEEFVATTTSCTMIDITETKPTRPPIMNFPAAAPPFAINPTTPASLGRKSIPRRKSMPVFSQAHLSHISQQNQGDLDGYSYHERHKEQRRKARPRQRRTNTTGSWQQQWDATAPGPVYSQHSTAPFQQVFVTNQPRYHHNNSAMGIRTPLTSVEEESTIQLQDPRREFNYQITVPLRRNVRSTVRVACVHCHKAKAKCDNERPCSRCKRLKKGGCVDRKHIKRTRKPPKLYAADDIIFERQPNAPSLICSHCKQLPPDCQCGAAESGRVTDVNRDIEHKAQPAKRPRSHGFGDPERPLMSGLSQFNISAPQVPFQFQYDSHTTRYDFVKNPLQIAYKGENVTNDVSRFCQFAYQTKLKESEFEQYRGRWEEPYFAQRVVEFLSRLVVGDKGDSYMEWVLNKCSTGGGCRGHKATLTATCVKTATPAQSNNLLEHPDCHLSEMPFGVLRATMVPSGEPNVMKIRVEMNEALCSMHGRTAEQIIESMRHTQYPTTMYHPTGWGNFFQGLLASFCGEHSDYSAINTIRRADERPVRVIQTSRYMRIKEGIPAVSLVCFMPVPHS